MLSWVDVFADRNCPVCRAAKAAGGLCIECERRLPYRVRWKMNKARGRWFLRWWRLACHYLRTGRLA